MLFGLNIYDRTPHNMKRHYLSLQYIHDILWYIVDFKDYVEFRFNEDDTCGLDRVYFNPNNVSEEKIDYYTANIHYYADTWYDELYQYRFEICKKDAAELYTLGSLNLDFMKDYIKWMK